MHGWQDAGQSWRLAVQQAHLDASRVVIDHVRVFESRGLAAVCRHRRVLAHHVFTQVERRVSDAWRLAELS